jgi:PST family polysaccharide transporter
MLRLGVGLLVSVWVARYLGPGQFGILNYSLSLTAIVGAFASLGLDSIVVREFVKEPERTGEILGTAAVLRFISGSLAFLTCVLISSIHGLIDMQSRSIVFIIAAEFIFQPFDVLEFWFQSRVKSKFPVLARNGAFLVCAVIKVVLILMGAPLIVFAIMVTFEIMLGGFGMYLMFRMKGERYRWSYSSSRAWMLFRDGVPLSLSALAIVTYMKVDQVMLGSMVDAKTVGIYAAAVKMVEVWYFVPSAITTSIFPYIVEARKNDHPLYLKRLQQLYDITAFMSFMLALIITFCSPLIIRFLYGSQYTGAAPVLTIYIWSGIATFLGVASSQFLLAENLTRISLYRTLLGMVTNVGLNLLLIPTYGMIGSAVATLVSYFLATFALGFFPSTRVQYGMMLKSLFVWRGLKFITSSGNAG